MMVSPLILISGTRGVDQLTSRLTTDVILQSVPDHQSNRVETGVGFDTVDLSWR